MVDDEDLTCGGVVGAFFWFFDVEFVECDIILDDFASFGCGGRRG